MLPDDGYAFQSGRLHQKASCTESEVMASQVLDLQSLLDYEVRSSKRYRRSFSLVLMAQVDGRVECIRSLKSTVRESDQLSELAGRIATVLMGETDFNGALAAVSRYKEACGDGVDLRFAVVSFPEDGTTAQHLLEAAHRRLNAALRLDQGTVVSRE